MRTDTKKEDKGMPEAIRNRAFLFWYRFVAKILASITLFCAAFSVVSILCKAEEALPEEVGNLYAKSAVLMDADSGRLLVSKDGNTMRPMASTTKILTCIIALEEGNMDEVIVASKEASTQPPVHLGMTEGESFYLRDLLYSLMLESHNDSAVAIAEGVCGSVAEFAVRMNEKAKELGCEQAHFVTPNGLDGEDEGGVHSISAADLARIISYCVTKSPMAKTFLEITQTGEYTFSDVEGKRSFFCTNHNLFLAMMDGAISGKTGFTDDAGYCSVGALRRDGTTFVVALLACGWPNHKNYKWADTRVLMNYGLEHYEYRDLCEVAKIEKKMNVPVNGGMGDGLFEQAYVTVEVENAVEEVQVLMREEEKVTAEIVMEEKLNAPVLRGQKVGTMYYQIGGYRLGECEMVLKGSVKKKCFMWVFEKLFEMFHQFCIITI